MIAIGIGFAWSSWRSPRPLAESFVTGLNQPRGMEFDDAGNLFIAEAGAVYPPVDATSLPITNHSGRVLRIAPDRRVTTVLHRLPFAHYPIAGDAGTSDVSVVGGAIYVLTGEGWDDRLSRSVLRVTPGGAPERVANLLDFAFATTPATEQLTLGGAPSNPYAMVAAPDGSTFYVTDGASGSVLSVTRDGTSRVFAALPKMPPLTGLTFGPDGHLYVAMFSALPLARGNGAIWAVHHSGHLSLAASGLTMPIDVAFDAAERMYVLEFSDGRQPTRPYAANSGRLLRIAQDGAQTIVLDRLNFPTAMSFSPAGDLFIAVSGAFSAPGQGTVLRVPREALNAF